jgi:hypothetical protein
VGGGRRKREEGRKGGRKKDSSSSLMAGDGFRNHMEWEHHTMLEPTGAMGGTMRA